MKSILLKRLCSVVLTVVMVLGLCAMSVSAGVIGEAVSVISNITADFENGYTSQDNNILVTDDSGNKVLKQKIPSSAENYYFELRDNSGNPLQLKDGKVYVITMDYKMVNIAGEDKTLQTSINLVRNTAKGGELVKVKNFTGAIHKIGDGAEWRTTSVVFKASIAGSQDYNRIGVNVISLSCSKTNANVDEKMTVVYFDNITVAECSESTKAIEFVSNGGSACDALAAQAGETISLPTPTRDLYDFVGWYTDAELNKAFGKTTMPSDMSTKLYAKWAPSDDAVLINFETGKGEKVPYIIGRAGDTVTLPKAKRDGYNFAGWYNKELTERQHLTTMPESTVTLYAKWEVIPIICDFENKDAFPTPNNATVTMRCAIEQTEVYRGKNALSYSFQRGFELSGSSNPDAIAGVILFDNNGEVVKLKAGTKYKISFNYKVIENDKYGVITMIAAARSGAWAERQSQIDSCELKYDKSDIKKGWQSHTFDFVWDPKNEDGSYAYIGFSGDGIVWADEIIIYESGNTFDASKTMLCFDTGAAPMIDTVYADYGSEYKLPVLEMEGYNFLGWCYDEMLTTTANESITLDKTYIKLYADWFKIPDKTAPAPEPDVAPEPQPQPEPEDKADNGWILWAGIAGGAVIVIAVVVIIVIKKKPSEETEKVQETSEETDSTDNK